jgi:hypothetical protein
MRRPLAVAILFLPLLAMCGHAPPLPPGMARLIVKCCELTNTGDHLVCLPLTSDLRVEVDDREVGTCLDWPRGGTVIPAGDHKIAVRPIVPLSEYIDCCLEEEVSVAIAAGEVHVEDFRLNVLRYPD